jgi:hypothetical protein
MKPYHDAISEVIRVVARQISSPPPHWSHHYHRRDRDHLLTNRTDSATGAEEQKITEIVMHQVLTTLVDGPAVRLREITP